MGFILTRDFEIEKAKKAAGLAALSYIKEGMVIGLGTGSTAHFFIEALGALHKSGCALKAMASSKASEELAIRHQIPLLSSNQVTRLDITVDGADAIDDQLNMIKGGGGALLREKILAQISDLMIVIVDSSKIVKVLGEKLLPVEVLPFCYEATKNRLKELGLLPILRRNKKNDIYITDNGNYIFDCHLDRKKQSLRLLEKALLKIAGVIETGLFLGLADHLIIGYSDGTHKRI
jgi:ribose 5-phosphate isomerase A